MKIAQINVSHYGSTGKIMLQIADQARARGHECKTFSRAWKNQALPSSEHAFVGSHFANGVHHIFAAITGKNEEYSKKGTKKLVKILENYQPDVLHLHNLHGWFIHLPTLFAYIKKSGVRVVWTLHDCWAFTGHCPYFDMVDCEKWTTGCFDCPQYKAYPNNFVDTSKRSYAKKKEWFLGVKDLTIVTPSKWLADLVKRSFLKDYNVQVINNGIDLSVFRPRESDFRVRYGLQDKYILLCVAFAWGKRKGLDVLIELSKRLDKRYQIVLVGTSENTEKQLSGNIISIRKTQNQTELAEIYSAADLFVNPTREEVFGLVNAEALACGTPVLTFKTGGSPEVIDETCGAVVDKDDIDAMQKEIERICAEKPYTSGACTSRAQIFDKNDKFNEYVDLYERK